MEHSRFSSGIFLRYAIAVSASNCSQTKENMEAIVNSAVPHFNSISGDSTRSIQFKETNRFSHVLVRVRT